MLEWDWGRKILPPLSQNSILGKKEGGLFYALSQLKLIRIQPNLKLKLTPTQKQKTQKRKTQKWKTQKRKTLKQKTQKRKTPKQKMKN